MVVAAVVVVVVGVVAAAARGREGKGRQEVMEMDGVCACQKEETSEGVGMHGYAPSVSPGTYLAH